MKQVVFMKYERILKKQAKQERKKKKAMLKAQKEKEEINSSSKKNRLGDLVYALPTPTNKSSLGGHFSKF